MVEVLFYAKPGCQGNARQMRVLQASGHAVVVRNLLTWPWTAEHLQSFFAGRLVAEWFNRSAVRVKSGEIVPERLGADEAMALLLGDPALIRRPLLEVAGERRAGWKPEEIAGWIGLGGAMSPGKEGCAGGLHHHEPAGAADAPTDPAECRLTPTLRAAASAMGGKCVAHLADE